MNPSDTHRRVHSNPRTDRPLPCEDIRALMMDYMQRDLGEGRSDVIREHTRRCPSCREHLAELQKTLGLLHDTSFPHGSVPEHLSDQHRARLARALMHPVLDWIYVHHILVSTLFTALVILALVIGLRRYRVWKENAIEPGIPVTIGKEGAGVSKGLAQETLITDD